MRSNTSIVSQWRKNPGPEVFTAEFCGLWRSNTNTQILHKIEKEGMLSYSFYIAKITLILKLDKNTTKKKIVLDKYRCKTSQ
jgi:hypothetical protein